MEAYNRNGVSSVIEFYNRACTVIFADKKFSKKKSYFILFFSGMPQVYVQQLSLRTSPSLFFFDPPQ